MTLSWYQAWICKPCAEGADARCSEPGCIFWLHKAGRPLGSEFSLVKLTSDQVDALDAAREFERGLQLEN